MSACVACAAKSTQYDKQMLYTPLHRLLGEAPGSITDAMIDAVIAQKLEESQELDFKTRLPDQKSMRSDDIVKDITALANAGGGVLVYGVEDQEKVAIARTDAGELSENYERSLQQLCTNAITPPVLGVKAYSVGAEPTRAVVLVVPPTVDSPHMFFANEKFAVPLRVNADTIWLRESQIAAAYRARFESASRAQRELEDLYEQIAEALEPERGAVLVGVARPRTPSVLTGRRDPDEARSIANAATLLARWWLAGNEKYHPLEDIAIYADRPGLRSWVMPANDDAETWRKAHAAIFDDGSIGLSWRAGGHRHGARGEPLSGWTVRTPAIEGFVGALLALVHAAAEQRPTGEVEVMVGIEWAPPESKSLPIRFVEKDDVETSPKTLTGKRFRRVLHAVDPSVSDSEFIQAAIEIATDCLNQIGIKAPRTLHRQLPIRPRRVY